MQPGNDGLHLALAVLLGDGMDLVDSPRADEHRALVADTDRAGGRHLGREHLDLEARRRLELGGRQLVGRGGKRRRSDRRQLCRSRTLRAPFQWRARRQRCRACGRGSPRGSYRLRLGPVKSAGDQARDRAGGERSVCSQHFCLLGTRPRSCDAPERNLDSLRGSTRDECLRLRAPPHPRRDNRASHSITSSARAMGGISTPMSRAVFMLRW